MLLIYSLYHNSAEHWGQDPRGVHFMPSATTFAVHAEATQADWDPDGFKDGIISSPDRRSVYLIYELCFLKVYHWAWSQKGRSRADKNIFKSTNYRINFFLKDQRNILTIYPKSLEIIK